jgi:hypothetical protein
VAPEPSSTRVAEGGCPCGVSGDRCATSVIPTTESFHHQPSPPRAPLVDSAPADR